MDNEPVPSPSRELSKAINRCSEQVGRELGGEEIPDLYGYQFPWCKYIHLDCLQATNVTKSVFGSQNQHRSWRGWGNLYCNNMGLLAPFKGLTLHLENIPAVCLSLIPTDEQKHTQSRCSTSYRNSDTNFLEFDTVLQHVALGVQQEGECLAQYRGKHQNVFANSNPIAFLPLSLHAEVISNIVPISDHLCQTQLKREQNNRVGMTCRAQKIYLFC